MKRLGHSLTWRTFCFIDGGCGANDLFGHTNGIGDFVLLDSLGDPWPVHRCYSDRYCKRVDSPSPRERVVGSRSLFQDHLRLAQPRSQFLVIREERVAEYLALEPSFLDKMRDAGTRADPEKFARCSQISVIGIVRERLPQHLTTLRAKLASVGSIITDKALGGNDSQLTVEDVDGVSYTFFLNLKDCNVKKGQFVEATLKVVRTALTPPLRFSCSSIFISPILRALD